MSELSETKTVQDMMVPLENYPRIYDDCTIRGAIAAMKSAQIDNPDGRKSLPRVLLVFDRAEVLVGIVGRRDIMRGLEPRFITESQDFTHPQQMFNVKVDPGILELSHEKALDSIRRQADRRITEVLVPLRATIHCEDHLMKAIGVMLESYCSLLPVLCHNTVVGVLRSVDLMHEIANVMGIQNEQSNERGE